MRKNALDNTHLGISYFYIEEVTPHKISLIIKSLDANKAPGTDKLPMKLVILVSDFLSKPISKALNNCITSCTFPENAKVATVALVSAYRKNCSSQHVLIRLLEEWKKCLDNNYVVGGVLTDLSKAFDCVPHDLLNCKTCGL